MFGAYWIYNNWDIPRWKIVDCPPFETSYFEWFPYHEGDTILFESDKELREYIVDSYTGYHKNNYLSNAKCGGCSDGISLSIVYENDTLSISFHDFKNGNNTPGLTLLLANGYQYYIEQKDNLLHCNLSLNYIDMPKDTIFNITIKKGVGISALNENYEVWKMKEHKKNSEIKDVEIKTEDCY